MVTVKSRLKPSSIDLMRLSDKWDTGDDESYHVKNSVDWLDRHDSIISNNKHGKIGHRWVAVTINIIGHFHGICVLATRRVRYNEKDGCKEYSFYADHRFDSMVNWTAIAEGVRVLRMG